MAPTLLFFFGSADGVGELVCEIDELIAPGVVPRSLLSELEVDELEDVVEEEVELELELELELDDEVELELVEESVTGLKVIPVYTTCNNKSVACPVNVV